MLFRSRPTRIGDLEFISLMALLMSMVALGIDTMLPALGVIGHELGVEDNNQTQLIISLIFLGIAIGQLLYGPLSDSIGRKPAISLGIIVFMLGSIMSLIASDFSTMLTGRLLQGIGLAGPRLVTIALIRDKFEGREMARVMSFVFTLFILTPVVAPALGQLIITFSHWRSIFGLFLFLFLISLVWLGLRQPETLSPEKRIPWSLKGIISAVKEVCSNRIAFGYTLTSGFINALFLAFLSTSPQILQQQYGLGAKFPAYFALLSIAVGLATFINGKLVTRLGMRMLSLWPMYFFLIVSILYLFPSHVFNGHPPLWTFIAYLMMGLFAIGFVFGNLNALAMQPLGHIAGIGAAVVGSLSTFMSVPLGIYIGHSYDGTILPLMYGFVICGALSIMLALWTEKSEIREQADL